MNEAHKQEKSVAERAERRQQVRGLLVLAFLVLLFSIFRAGFYRVFTPGWWRLW